MLQEIMKMPFVSQEITLKGFDSGVSFVVIQNSRFAPLAAMAALCSSDQQPKSVGGTLLQLACRMND